MYLNKNDGENFSGKKRQFSRRNQHYISHLATYDLEKMMEEITPKHLPRKEMSPISDYEDVPIPMPPPLRVSKLAPLRNSSEVSGRNNYHGVLQTVNPYQNPIAEMN